MWMNKSENNFQQKSFFNGFQAPRAPEFSAPPPQDNKMESMLNQIIANHHQSTKDFNAKAEGIYMDLNGKIETLNLHVKKIEVQVVQTGDAVKRQSRVLPEKVEENPKNYCNVISELKIEVIEPHPYAIPEDDSLSSAAEGDIQINNLGPRGNKAKKSRSSVKMFPKEVDRGQFIFACKIAGVKFPNSL